MVQEEIIEEEETEKEEDGKKEKKITKVQKDIRRTEEDVEDLVKQE